jgi:uncharacterized membrane protein
VVVFWSREYNTIIIIIIAIGVITLVISCRQHCDDAW